jgi:hypothetical protein
MKTMLNISEPRKPRPIPPHEPNVVPETEAFIEDDEDLSSEISPHFPKELPGKVI